MTRVVVPRSDACSPKTITVCDTICMEGAFIPDSLRCGWTVAAGCGLAATVAAGKGWLCGLFIQNTASCTVSCLTASMCNHIFAQFSLDACCIPSGFTFVTNTTGCTPAGASSIKIGVATTGACMVCSVSTEPTQTLTVIGTGTCFPKNPVCSQPFIKDSVGKLSIYRDNITTATRFPPVRIWGNMPTNAVLPCDVIGHEFIAGVSGCSCTNALCDDLTRYCPLADLTNLFKERNDASSNINPSVTCDHIQIAADGGDCFNVGGVMPYGGDLGDTWVFRFTTVFTAMTQGACSGNSNVFFGWQVRDSSLCNGVNLPDCANVKHIGISLFANSAVQCFRSASGSGSTDWLASLGGASCRSPPNMCLPQTWYNEWVKAGACCNAQWTAYSCCMFCMVVTGWCTPLNIGGSGINTELDSLYFGHHSQMCTSATATINFSNFQLKSGVSTF